jgi:hypothetical protein
MPVCSGLATAAWVLARRRRSTRQPVLTERLPSAYRALWTRLATVRTVHSFTVVVQERTIDGDRRGTES